MKIDVLSVSRSFPSIKLGEQTVTLLDMDYCIVAVFQSGQQLRFSGSRKDPGSIKIGAEYNMHNGDPTRKVRIRLLSK